MNKAGKNVVAVLPNCFGDDDRSIVWNALKDVHAITLAIDEAVRLVREKGMSSLELAAKTIDSCCKGFFHGLLCGPAFLIGGESQIVTCKKVYSFGHGEIP